MTSNNMIKVENKYGHGARLDNTVRYYYRKLSKPKLGRLQRSVRLGQGF
jgi:hypothetical protein